MQLWLYSYSFIFNIPLRSKEGSFELYIPLCSKDAALTEFEIPLCGKDAALTEFEIPLCRKVVALT